jgi:hypothetical protein
MNHEMTLVTDTGQTRVTCSCGQAVFSHDNTGISIVTRIPWNDLSLAVMEHLRPEADQIIRDLLRKISVKDIIREILRRRS